MKSGPFYMAQESEAPICPVYIYGAYSLMNKGQIVPNEKGVVVVEYQKQIESKGKSHEVLKAEVEKSLQEAEARWAGKKIRKGGYSLAYCMIPIVTLMVAVLKMKAYF